MHVCDRIPMNWHDPSQPGSDNRKVVLIKSLTTNNRFYTLVPPDSGIRNADTVEKIPDNLLLGIAYPCLEDGLNDFAVIRTTYETLDFFPDDEAMRRELMEIVNDARGKLVRRLTELRDRIAFRSAHFLGTNLEDFKSYALDIIHRGYPRRNLDSMMKLNVFSSVAEQEGVTEGSEPLYFLRFRNHHDLPRLSQQPARDFVAALFGDVLAGVEDDANYASRYAFDKNVFQKFIALMFVNYATTDPIFYGTNKADYGVSSDREMDETPLYRAIGAELRQIERTLAEEDHPTPPPTEQEAALALAATEAQREPRLVQLPGTLINEDVLLAPIATICATASRLAKSGDRETAELARVVLSEASTLIAAMKDLGIVSPFAYDASANHHPHD